MIRVFTVWLVLMGCASTAAGASPIREQRVVQLGGTAQFIELRGADTANPVLLILHGGPGEPERIFTRRYLAGLENRFVVVDWDQRGSGKSYRSIEPRSDLRVQRFVDDACELARTLCSWFKQDRIFVLGHSWGSFIGTLAVKQHPELFCAYVGVGQMVQGLGAMRLTYQFALSEARRQAVGADVALLELIGPPPYSVLEAPFKLAIPIVLGTSYEEALYPVNAFREGKMWDLLLAMDYSPLEKSMFFRRPLELMAALSPEIMQLDFLRDMRDLPIPVVYVMGRYDRSATPVSLVDRFFEQLRAPYKRLVHFERSGHCALFEQPDDFIAVMDDLLERTGRRRSIATVAASGQVALPKLRPPTVLKLTGMRPAGDAPPAVAGIFRAAPVTSRGAGPESEIE